MFQHGKLKEKKSEPSELEKEQLKKKLESITTINKDILKKRNSNDNEEEKYNINKLEYLFKASKMMTDSTTIFNYRKEIILYNKKTMTPENYYDLLKQEIQKITALTMSSPKSYVLWNHREFVLNQASPYEADNGMYSKCLLIQDLAMCNLFLMKDDRNFHVWNYRLVVVLLISKYFNDKFYDLLDKEIEFSMKKIKESCSNFSAWHYRAKLINIYFCHKNISWNSEECISYFKEDLNFLQKAMYTDPKDQSPWNYHLLLIQSFLPVYICNIIKNENYFEFKLSDSINFSCLKQNDEIILNNLNKMNENLLISKEFKISTEVKYIENVFEKIDNTDNIEDSKNKYNDILSINDHLKSKADNYLLSYVKTNLFLPNLKIENGNFEYISPLKKHHIDFILNQLVFVSKLISDSDGFLEFAIHRRIQLNQILYDNIRYLSKEIFLENFNEDTLKNEIDEDFNSLIKNSKRSKGMFIYLKGKNENSRSIN